MKYGGPCSRCQVSHRHNEPCIKWWDSVDEYQVMLDVLCATSLVDAARKLHRATKVIHDNLSMDPLVEALKEYLDRKK